MKNVTLSVTAFVVGVLAVNSASAQTLGGVHGVVVNPGGGLPHGGLPPGLPFPGGVLPPPLPAPPPSDLDPCCHIYVGGNPGPIHGVVLNPGAN